jgi:tetratricopeptide (TPR) repeat protein
VDAVGTGLLLAARVEEVATGHLVAEASIPAADANAVVETVGALSKELRRGLGEARAALANTDPLPQVLTPSLDALRIYREGMGFHLNFQPGLGVPRFREALELDPEFGAAHFSLFAGYHNLGQPDSALASALRALDSPDRLSDVQRRALEAMVKYWSDFASWDVSMFRTGNGVGDALLLTDFQLFDQAWTNIKAVVEEFVRQNRRFDPERRLATDGNPAWRNLVRLAIATGRVPEYNGLLDSLRVEVSEYSALMKNLDSNDWDRADSIRNSAPDIWTTHTNKRTAVAVLDAVRGRIRQSAEHWESFRSFRVSPDRVRLMYTVLYGTPGIDNPVALTDRGLDAVEAYVAHGVREAILGDTVEAKAVRAGMEAARNAATSELFEAAFEPMFALLDAGITMRRGEWIEATGILEPISGRLGEPGYGFISDRFLVRWILAEAYAQLGSMDSSIEELNAVLLERSFDPLFVLVYPPAHFKLGQLHAQVGDSERAMNHFRLFLEVFIDPDQEYAWMVEEAQAELVKLEG